MSGRELRGPRLFYVGGLERLRHGLLLQTGLSGLPGLPLQTGLSGLPLQSGLSESHWSPVQRKV